MELSRALERVRDSGTSREAFGECLQTLYKVAENAAQKWNPTSGAKYRIIKQSSATITNKVTSLPGGRDCMLGLGFIDTVDGGEPVWKVPQDRACVDKLWDGLAVLRQEKDKVASIPVDQAKSEAANKAGGLEGTIRDMLTSPAKLNQILKNPMVKQMISSNPEFVEGLISSTPEARETLTIYPEMRTQLESIMGRPLRLEDRPVATAPAAGSAGSLPFESAPATGPVTARTVQAFVYDITGGMAKGMAQMLVGKQIDLVPHTGIVVFGREYYFGSGPLVCDSPGKSVPAPVAQTIVLGETSKSREELEAYINSVLALEHTEQNYNLLNHNCNHYANDIAKFLLDGKGLPESIVNFAQEALSTPQGQQLRAMIENMERNMRQGGAGSGMNPFGSGATGAASLNPFGGPPSGGPPPAAAAEPPGGEILARLLEMGFPAERCREAAAGCGGEFDLALALVTSMGD